MEERVLTVSALNNYIKSIFDNNIYLQSFLIEGEVSNFKWHSSGHLYFSLKDNSSQINCVMFASSARTLNFTPKNGNKVILRGRLSSYTATGTYQIYVSKMKLAGIGDLFLKFEQLKKELNSLGYFNEDRKKKIPRFVHTIGVVTSPTGAVIRDIIKTINKRYNKVKLILYPTKVQGEGSEKLIAASLNKANEDGLVDVIILARGGGSMEDLWPFNERIVADAIYHSKVPIISAVGHETDFTIADYVADLRSPTPTAAGTYVVPDKESLFEQTNNVYKLLNKIYQNRIDELNMQVLTLDKSLNNLKPTNIIKREKNNLIKVYRELKLLYNKQITYKKTILKEEEFKIKNNSLEKKIMLIRRNLDNLLTNLKHNYEIIKNSKREKYALLSTKLDSLSPLKVMSKGYSLAKVKGKYLRSVKEVKVADVIETTLADGIIISEVKEIK